MSKVKLFCLPYAGGSALVFNKWSQYLKKDIELIPFELAGRGRRIHEAFYENLDEVVEESFISIRKNIGESSYALFGHSMGSLIGYKLIQKIQKERLPSPLIFFSSGRRAPHIQSVGDKKYHLMDDKQFKREVIGLGGTPKEFFDHPELMELFLPILKNDFRILETDKVEIEITPLENDITVLLGVEDELTKEQSGWELHTKKNCNIHHFEGGHFFLNDQTEQVVDLINRTLSVNQ